MITQLLCNVYLDNLSSILINNRVTFRMWSYYTVDRDTLGSTVVATVMDDI